MFLIIPRLSTVGMASHSAALREAVAIPIAKQVRNYVSAAKKPARTALFDFHIQNGAKMVSFAGWEMPVGYSKLSHIQSHLHTRQKASIFDVSHMLQTEWIGNDRVKFIERLVVGDIAALPIGSSTLSLFTNENGGIIDDTVIQKLKDSLYIVSNAGCAEKDLAHFEEHVRQFKAQGGDVEFRVLEEKSLIALQGPAASFVVQELTGENLSTFKFMTGRPLSFKGINCHVSRCGYTGEDGFEISVLSKQAPQLAELLLSHSDVELAGLGARDSLRLEAGLCLYGHDLEEDITPVEGSLVWTIGQRRRVEGNFLGAEKILPQIKGGVSKRRVGFIVEGAPAREHVEIFNSKEEKIGYVTSGCPSPTLKKNIGMAYLAKGFTKVGTDVLIKVRNRMQKAKVAKMPFVENRYFRG